MKFPHIVTCVAKRVLNFFTYVKNCIDYRFNPLCDKVSLVTSLCFIDADSYYHAHPVVIRLFLLSNDDRLTRDLPYAIAEIKSKFAGASAIMYSTKLFLVRDDESFELLTEAVYKNDCVPITPLGVYMGFPVIAQDHLGNYKYVNNLECEDITPKHKFWHIALEN